MFYEVIYTRCRYGIDLVKGQTITGEGGKVYDVSRELLEEGEVDLPFLVKAAESVQSYKDPSFMDDAYIYLVPDTGDSFLVDFHPICYNPDAEGDYSNRPGNFINHILVGDFSEIYPFEMFHDRRIWTAQEREEAYYYSHKPDGVCAGQNITAPSGRYTVENVKKFIADGRQEALKQAVAFLILQYEESPDKRKFLVIRDETTTDIELWIAAIESAFSPRMAAGLSFATRLDRFDKNNKYTVNQLGVYQQQINLQDPNQSRRYKAMIVGVTDDDEQNVSAARPLQSSPFVLLDGKQKKALFSENTVDSYFDLITRFDDEQMYFCREFMQTFEIKKPSRVVFSLYRHYCALNDENVSAAVYSDVFRELKNYNICNSTALRGIYNQANKKAEQYIGSDFGKALIVMEWVKKAAVTIQDNTVEERFTSKVRKIFVQRLYAKDSRDEINVFWETIKDSVFLDEIVKDVLDPEIIKKYEQKLYLLSAEEFLQIIQIYFETENIAHVHNPDMAKTMINYCVEKCFQEKNEFVLDKLNTILFSRYNTGLEDLWIEIAKLNDIDIATYIMKFVLDVEKEITDSEKKLFLFCEKLSAEGYENVIYYAMKKYIENISSLPDLKRFLKRTSFASYLSQDNILCIYKIIDKKIGISMKGTKDIAEMLQSVRGENVKYINSAHISAANLIINHRGKTDLQQSLQEYVEQGFPSIVDEEYIDEITTSIEKKQLSQKEYIYLVKMFVSAPSEYTRALLETACKSAVKKPDLWNYTLMTVSKMKNTALRNKIYSELVDMLVETKQNKKTLKNLGDSIENDSAYEYYCAAADDALQIRENQSKRKTKKLFSIFRKK